MATTEITRTCEHCGAEFTREKRRALNQRFCSPKCGSHSPRCHHGQTRDYKGTTSERLAARTLRAGPDECWLWTGHRNAGGYGCIGGPGRAIFLTHRVAYELEHGAIPDDLNVLHRCDNPPCVNPSHLFLGTHQDNSDDKFAKGRDVSFPGEKNGRAKLTALQVADIRARRSAGESPFTIAQDFGVTYKTIWMITTHRHWR